MIIGVPKEVKKNEYRVGLTPKSVSKLTSHNNTVFVEKDAGSSIGYADLDYQKSGATILESPKELYGSSELIVKVKESFTN